MKMTNRIQTVSKLKSKNTTVYNKLILLDDEDKFFAGESFKIFIVPKNTKGNYSSALGGTVTEPNKVLHDACNNFAGCNLTLLLKNSPLDDCFSNLRYNN